jgi:hypothetical protein
MRQSPQIATLHALLTVCVGLWFVLFGREPIQVAYVAAYLAGAEVLWRMTGAQVFWEYGKYATIGLLLLSIFTTRHSNRSALPFIYMALLVPSTVLTIFDLSPDLARHQISFNLSGPLALAVCAWFFSGVRLSRAQLRTMLHSAIGPIVGIASVTLFVILTTTSLTFTDDSNIVSSGGFGPNQVSSVLGLGALLAFISVLDNPDWKARGLLFGVMVFLAVQSALTFSRGGLYNAVGGILVASLFLLRDARSRIRLLLVAGLLLFVGNSFILPALNEVTGGALLHRFQDTDLTHRDEIALHELGVWAQYPFFGIGPGQAYTSGIPPAHTEFTRLLAEHGMLGFAAMLLLIGVAVRNIRRANTIKSKALVASLLAWGFLFMLNAAMRVVAPSFIIGLTFAQFDIESESNDRS